MRVDLKCPGEIISTELHREENDVRLILMNLSDRGIDSCEATVRVMSREGEELARAVHRARALRGRPHTAFSMSVPVEIPETAVCAEAVLDKVWFEDHDVWRRNPAKELEYEPNALPAGNDLNALKYVAGENAVGFPSQQQYLWVCVCGRPNGNEESICGRCRRQRETIFQLYNRNAVLRQVSQRERQLDLETRGAREETARLQRLREEEYDWKKRRQKKRRHGIIALLILLALGAGIFWGGIPAYRLWTADRALQEDRLEEAQSILTELGGYPGAEQRLKEAEARITRRDGITAAEDPTAFEPDRMVSLAASLRALDTEEDSALADRVELSRARALLDSGNTDGAEQLAAALPGALPGRDELLKACTLARAEKAMAEREYLRARELYLSLGEHPGAAEKAKEALYESALADLEAGAYDQARAAFTELGDYEDSASLISRCWYLKGYTLEETGEAEEARLAYLEAGEYEDARDRALAIRWNQAEAALAAQELETALPLYRELDGYREARTKWIQCATELARKAYRQREYAIAASWLEGLPEDTRDTKQIRTRAYYLGAKAAASRGELENAIETMEKVSDYSDAAKNIRKWRIDLAGRKMEAGLYEEALTILEPVAENYNARRLIQEAEKKLAEKAQQEDAANLSRPEETEAPTEPAETEVTEAPAAPAEAKETEAPAAPAEAKETEAPAEGTGTK